MHPSNAVTAAACTRSGNVLKESVQALLWFSFQFLLALEQNLFHIPRAVSLGTGCFSTEQVLEECAVSPQATTRRTGFLVCFGRTATGNWLSLAT